MPFLASRSEAALSPNVPIWCDVHSDIAGYKRRNSLLTKAGWPRQSSWWNAACLDEQLCAGLELLNRSAKIFWLFSERINRTVCALTHGRGIRGPGLCCHLKVTIKKKTSVIILLPLYAVAHFHALTNLDIYAVFCTHCFFFFRSSNI